MMLKLLVFDIMARKSKGGWHRS